MRTYLQELNSNDFINAMNLYEFDLSHNKLKVIKNTVFSAKERKADLMPDSTDIANITVDRVHPLHILSSLNLDQNEISEIEDYSLYGLNGVYDLRLKENRLTAINRNTLAGLPQLVFLDLAQNKIETIEDGALNFPALQILYLQKNKLRTLSDAVFERLPMLEMIKLERNRLEHIGRSVALWIVKRRLHFHR